MNKPRSYADLADSETNFDPEDQLERDISDYERRGLVHHPLAGPKEPIGPQSSEVLHHFDDTPDSNLKP